jgi:hypothetical protein
LSAAEVCFLDMTLRFKALQVRSQPRPP